ncbi:hypothetical protein DSO57_1016128 [Entomophthora muscae]|uniref:Uncharacterized protein n=1 Tax=Entomophthora muscae TaxID=34485 RepID=A0ACC2SHP7_9FUNG|nr:hypothetical protein DSO57_1016128 [Entomophthora muscae]
MTLPLTPRPNRPLEPTTAAKTTSTQLFGVLYITLTGLVDSMVPNSGPWSLLGQSVSYIIKLAPILWWALPTGLAAPHPELPNASTYDWLPDTDNGSARGMFPSPKPELSGLEGYPVSCAGPEEAPGEQDNLVQKSPDSGVGLAIRSIGTVLDGKGKI